MLEMPPYRWPKVSQLGMRLFDRAKVFLHRAGTLILTVAVVLWILLHVPLDHGHAPPIEKSIAGDIGHAIEPAIRPLGFNWKIGIGLISSLAARETIVGTLGTIYGTEGEADSGGLQQAVKKDISPAAVARAIDLFRLCAAMHVDHRRRAPRDRRVEVAGFAVHLYVSAGVCRLIRRIPSG